MKHILITYPQGANFFWLYHYSIASKGFAKTRVQIIFMRTVSFGPPSGFKWHKTDFIWFFILLFHVISMLDDLWGSFLCTILILATLNISQLHPAAPEPFLWLAVYRWKCQNHQRPQRSQRFQNFLRHRRESGRERGGGPWWIFVACWPLWRKGLYRFEGLANVSWMWIDSIVLVRVQSFGCPNVVTHMSTQRQRKHEVLAFAFWVVGCSALNKHGSECVRMASWYKLARRISSLRQEYRDYSSGLFLCGPQVASNGMNQILFGFLCVFHVFFHAGWFVMICAPFWFLQFFSFLSHLHPAGSTRAIAVIGCVQVKVPEPPKAPEVPKARESWWSFVAFLTLLKERKV